jgi:phosphohistidine phosphatase
MKVLPDRHEMKRLFILRHAKSSWDDASLSDFERPLNEVGLDVAPFMGRYMAGHGYLPKAIVSSPARRARETAELIKINAGIGGDIRFDDRIYEASPNTLLQVASELGDDLDSALIVGHNPGIEGFIRHLTGQIEPMPTAALAVIDLDIDPWRKIGHNTGKIVTVIRPKAVM